jgi:outer membrane usher protein FimD/PapC
MKPSILPTTTLATLVLFGGGALQAQDPLLDDLEPALVWTAAKNVVYRASETPTWEAGSTLGAGKEWIVGPGFLSLNGQVGFAVQEFQIDSGWSLVPELSAGWNVGRLSLDGWGWGLRDDVEWSDYGGGSSVGWSLSDPATSGARWSTALSGSLSEASGSSLGLSLRRSSNGERWSTRLSLSANRLWDADLSIPTSSNPRRSLVQSDVADQWQGRLSAGLDRNWHDLSAGIGLATDVRAFEIDPTLTANRNARSKRSSQSTTGWTGTADPSASLSWTPGTWEVSLTSGYTLEAQTGSGQLEPTATMWTSLSTSKSW